MVKKILKKSLKFLRTNDTSWKINCLNEGAWAVGTLCLAVALIHLGTTGLQSIIHIPRGLFGTTVLAKCTKILKSSVTEIRQ